MEVTCFPLICCACSNRRVPKFRSDSRISNLQRCSLFLSSVTFPQESIKVFHPDSSISTLQSQYSIPHLLLSNRRVPKFLFLIHTISFIPFSFFFFFFFFLWLRFLLLNNPENQQNVSRRRQSKENFGFLHIYRTTPGR